MDTRVENVTITFNSSTNYIPKMENIVGLFFYYTTFEASSNSMRVFRDVYFSDIGPSGTLDHATTINNFGGRYDFTNGEDVGYVDWAFGSTNLYIQTNLCLSAREIRQWDVYHAVAERQKIFTPEGGYQNFNLPQGGYQDIGGVVLVHPPGFYRYNEEFLLRDVKDWITNYCTFFVDKIGIGTNGFSVWPTNYAGIGRLLSQVPNVPQNYFQYTPARGLDGAYSYYTRTQAVQWVVSCADDQICTNIAEDSCGETNSISGTNGQVVSSTCLNTNIEGSHTSADYGYDNITNFFSLLVWTSRSNLTWGGYATNNGEGRWEIQAGFNNIFSFDDAKDCADNYEACEADTPGHINVFVDTNAFGRPYWNVSGHAEGETNAVFWSVTKEGRSGSVYIPASSNLACDVDFYAVFPEPAQADCETNIFYSFTGGGPTLSPGFILLFSGTKSQSDTNVVFSLLPTKLGPWVDDPVSAGAFCTNDDPAVFWNISQGWTMESEVAVLKWDTAIQYK